ncbi:MAG: methyl-accepting chemotaxis protein [Planctomycetota bacterium]|nr:methyl-accepting chemotaxis protein [Planctomycetota bacterium]
MKWSTWLNRYTSMRGRLSILIIGFLVTPVVVTAFFVAQAVGNEEQSRVDAAVSGLETAVELRLSEAASSLSQLLDGSLSSMAMRAARLDGPLKNGEIDPFEDWSPALRPTYVGFVSASGSVTPPLPAPLADRIMTALGRGEPVQGHEAFEDSSEVSPHRLAQVVIEPIRNGNSIVMIRDVSGASGAALLSSLPAGRLLDRALTVKGTPVAVTGSGLAPDRLSAPWLAPGSWEVAASSKGRQLPPHRVWEGLHYATVPLLNLEGAPVGMMALRAAPDDVLPFWARFGDRLPLPHLLNTVVGWVAIVGVLIAIFMGMLAPQWIWSDIRQSTNQISETVQRLRHIAGRNKTALAEQAEVVRTLDDSFSNLKESSLAIDASAQSLARNAQQSEQVSHSGSESVEIAERSMLDMQNRVSDVTELMEHLGRHAHEIDQILEYVHLLNAGTKKLSVNAGIKSHDQEAAARQLALVAREVRDLAAQGMDYTDDIERRVSEIKSSSDNTLAASREGREEVRRCLETFGELQVSFGRILHWMEETTDFVHRIEGSTGRQSDSLNDVSVSVLRLQERATESKESFEEVEEAIAELATLGEEIRMHWKVG